MKWIRPKLVLLGMMATATCTAVFFWPSSQPSYQRRTLQQWLEDCPDQFSDYETYGGPGPRYLEVQTAVRAMGTNAVPALIGMFTSKDSRLKKTVVKSLPRWVPVRPCEASKQHQLAQTGFRLLGTQAFPAIPTLTNLVSQPEPETQLRALISLRLITSNREVLLPVLTGRLKDPDWQVRAVASTMLKDGFPDKTTTNAVGFE